MTFPLNHSLDGSSYRVRPAVRFFAHFGQTHVIELFIFAIAYVLV